VTPATTVYLDEYYYIVILGLGAVQYYPFNSRTLVSLAPLPTLFYIFGPSVPCFVDAAAINININNHDYHSLFP
jgi:hypothetical protein